MLTMFQCRRTYHKLVVSLMVDLERKDVSGTIAYDRRIVHMFDAKDAPFHEVCTPDKAEAWLSRPLGERGSFVETMEWQGRMGLLSSEPQLQAA